MFSPGIPNPTRATVNDILPNMLRFALHLVTLSVASPLAQSQALDWGWVLRRLACTEEAWRQRHVTQMGESKEQIHICEGFIPLDLSFCSSSDLVNIR